MGKSLTDIVGRALLIVSTLLPPVVSTGCGKGRSSDGGSVTPPIDNPVDTTAPVIQSFTSLGQVSGSDNLYKLGTVTNFNVEAIDEDQPHNERDLLFTYQFGDGGVILIPGSTESNIYGSPGIHAANVTARNRAGITSNPTTLVVSVTQYTTDGIVEIKKTIDDLTLVGDSDVIGGGAVNKSVWKTYVKDKLGAGDADSIATLAQIEEFEIQEAGGEGINPDFQSIDEIFEVRYAEKDGVPFLIYTMKIIDSAKFSGLGTGTYQLVRKLEGTNTLSIETMKAKIKNVINTPLTALEAQDLLASLIPEDADQSKVDYTQRKIRLIGTVSVIDITGSARYKINGRDITAVFDYHPLGGSAQPEITQHRAQFLQPGDTPAVNTYVDMTAVSAQLGTLAVTAHKIYKRIMDTFAFHTNNTQ